jgi:hypothetical protein
MNGSQTFSAAAAATTASKALPPWASILAPAAAAIGCPAAQTPLTARTGARPAM